MCIHIPINTDEPGCTSTDGYSCWIAHTFCCDYTYTYSQKHGIGRGVCSPSQCASTISVWDVKDLKERPCALGQSLYLCPGIYTHQPPTDTCQILYPPTPAAPLHNVYNADSPRWPSRTSRPSKETPHQSYQFQSQACHIRPAGHPSSPVKIRLHTSIIVFSSRQRYPFSDLYAAMENLEAASSNALDFSAKSKA